MALPFYWISDIYKIPCYKVTDHYICGWSISNISGPSICYSKEKTDGRFFGCLQLINSAGDAEML